MNTSLPAHKVCGYCGEAHDSVSPFRVPESDVTGKLCGECRKRFNAERGEQGLAPLLEVVK